MTLTRVACSCVFSVVLFSACSVKAQVTKTSSAVSPAIAAERLQSVSTFAFGGVGFAGTTSQGEVAYRTIAALPREQALTIFEQVYRAGNAQAKCYALVGIHRLDPLRFKELHAALRNEHAKVSTMQGCILSHHSLSDIAQRIAEDYYHA